MFRNCRGVTLLELIIAIGIVGIIASLAIPAFDNQIKNSKLTSTGRLLQTAYASARSEAINRGVQVSVSGDSSGLTVQTVGTAETLNTFTPNAEGITWSASGVLPTITYNSNGYRAGGTVETITLTDDRGVVKTITISASGGTTVY